MSGVKEKFWIDAAKAALVVIDVQEKLAPAMNPKLYARLEENLPLLIEGCQTAGVPIIATEQYPKGLGHTPARLPGRCRRILCCQDGIQLLRGRGFC